MLKHDFDVALWVNATAPTVRTPSMCIYTKCCVGIPSTF